MHINAAGSNFANKRELDAAAVKRADRIVADDVAVARLESGDLIGAEAEAGLDWSAVLPLSDVVAGKAAGRTSPGEVTLFESQGIGLEDLAAACRVLQLAREPSELLVMPTTAMILERVEQGAERLLHAHRMYLDAIRRRDKDAGRLWVRRHLEDWRKGFERAG